jgi:hypothetical protein
MIRWAIAKKGKQIMVTKICFYLEDREGRKLG